MLNPIMDAVAEYNAKQLGNELLTIPNDASLYWRMNDSIWAGNIREAVWGHSKPRSKQPAPRTATGEESR